MFQLDLNHFFYPEVTVKANKDHMAIAKEGKRKSPDTEISMQYFLRKDAGRIGVVVQIYVDDLKDEDPYDFTIEVFGSFVVERIDGKEVKFDEEFEQREKGLVLNAVQILVGCVRDTLHTVSGKGPFGPILLPTVYLAESDMPERSE